MKNILFIFCAFTSCLLFVSCSNQKNTKATRLYHEINTRYNIYFNAEQAYEDALERKNSSYKDNLSEMIHVYPYYPDYEEQKTGGFDATIDKTTKAIKLHSIQVKPERDPSKRGNIAYQEWLNQREFNPFLKNAWLLMAKAEYQSLDYLRAITSFSYISRMFKNDAEVVAESRLWIANAYLQMNWLYEGENVLRQIDLSGGVPDKFEGMYAEVYASYMVKSRRYEEAIPYLETAIKHEGGWQKMRLRYLLAQLYSKTGNRQKAYEAFGKVQGLSTPYEFSINAKLQQSQFVDVDNLQERKKVLLSLQKMTKTSKNDQYLDQIYYIIGNIYLQVDDSVKAIENYNLAINKSVRNGYDKAIAQITLGDIYFHQRKYVQAQPLYPEALGTLGKSYERYKEFMLRSEVLDKLAVYDEAIILQDSLQTLARMPEDERIAAINDLIKEIKRQDEEERKRQARAEWELENASAFNNEPLISQRPPASMQMGGGQSVFYFYNEQTVAQGKTAFRNLWGNRKLEDNWRRKDKSTSFFDDFAEEIPEEDGLPADSIGGPDIAVDRNLPATPDGEDEKYTVEYYLKQIPLTPEALKESDDIIEDAYFNMGMIYKDDLFDFSLAIEAFNTDLNRFPLTPNMEEIYYHLFLIYLQTGDRAMMENYRARLLNQFPQGTYAKALSDPDYEWNLRNIIQIENRLYQETYDFYMAGNVDAVRRNYAVVQDKYPLTRLMPKFMFINALTYAQTNESAPFRENLTDLINKYPESDVVPMASEMLKGVISGRPLVGGARGMIWNVQFGMENIGDVEIPTDFSDTPDAEHMFLLIYDPKDIDRNALLYEVADYNFSNFVLKTFDLRFTELNPFEVLEITGFESLHDIADYTNLLFESDTLVQKLDSSIVMVPISVPNYGVLIRGKSLVDYFGFVKENYAETMPGLIAYWEKQFTENPEEDDFPELQTENTDSLPSVIDEQPEDLDDIGPIELKLKPKDEPVQMREDTVDKEDDDIYNAPDERFDNSGDPLGDAVKSITKNPVDGIRNLITSNKNKPKLTKEEKEVQKEQQRIQKEIQKEQKNREKAIKDSIAAIEKAEQDSLKNIEREKIEMEKAVVKAKEDARKDAAKAKEEARKMRQQELKEKEKSRNEQLKAKEKARKEQLKEKERIRKEREKQRQAERREKEKLAKEKKR